MKKLVILASFVLILPLAGCGLPEGAELGTGEPSEAVIGTTSADVGQQNPAFETTADNSAMAASTTPGKKPIKRFYPESGSGVSADSGTTDSAKPISTNPDQSFVVTPELIAKLYLIDKYDPGVCFGMPGPVPQSSIDSLIAGNKQLSEFLKQRYKISSDLDVYNKLKQLQDVQLTVVASSKYKFQFMDGQCCSMTFYQGTVEVSGDKATDIVTNKESRTNPC